jgi:hypothetical protein
MDARVGVPAADTSDHRNPATPTTMTCPDASTVADAGGGATADPPTIAAATTTSARPRIHRR